MDSMQFNFGTLKRILGLAQRTYKEYQKIQDKGNSSQSSVPRSSRPHTAPRSSQVSQSSLSYPGDYRGTIDFSYSPNADGKPDPGEVVWTWVPYEEDFSQGKDRPVILVGRDGAHLLALMLTSKDHNSRTEHDSNYLDIGIGAWDRQGRPSEVKLNRVIRVNAEAVRREGSIMDAGTFNRIKEAFKQAHH